MNDQPTQDDTVPIFPPPGAQTHHQLSLGQRTVHYQAIAEWLTLRRIHMPVAHMFHTAYLETDAPAPVRPLTFVFNGGPGAASAYLHMGALGPQRVAFASQGRLPAPPTQVVDNLESWLSFTDLVFIDPLGTGFSRAIKESLAKDDPPKSPEPEENKAFWEVQRDLESLGEFIVRFLSEHHRWTSPIFIAGESYGGFRVAKMARQLQESYGVGLCGAMLISPAIEFGGLFGSDYNQTHWLELLPSLAAAAHQHRQTKGCEQLSVAEVAAATEQFVTNDVAPWLALGDHLDPAKRSPLIQKMSELTGISADRIARAGGRLSATMFCRELLRDEQRLLGRYDASVTTVDPYPDRSDYEGPDPSLFAIDRLFTGAINHHLRATLEVDTSLNYRLLSMKVNKGWKDEQHDHVFRKIVGSMDDLRYGMSLNPHMKVMITHGYFDLITPYFSSRRLGQLMKLADEQRDNIRQTTYLGGHMYYSWDESRHAFRDDACQFYEDATPVVDRLRDTES